MLIVLKLIIITWLTIKINQNLSYYSCKYMTKTAITTSSTGTEKSYHDSRVQSWNNY